jgi:hypothetical protein
VPYSVLVVSLHQKFAAMYVSSQQATEKYKLSLRTLRTLIAKLTSTQRQKYIKIEGKRQLISTELLSSRYELRTGVTDALVSDGASVQNDGASVQLNSTGVTDALVSDGASVQNDGASVQNDGASVQLDSTGVTDALVSDGASVQNDGASVQLIAQQQNQIAHLQNEVSNLHDRLKEANYIAANLAKQIAPSTTKVNDGFFWFIVGLVLGFTCLGFVIWFNS